MTLSDVGDVALAASPSTLQPNAAARRRASAGKEAEKKVTFALGLLVEAEATVPEGLERPMA